MGPLERYMTPALDVVLLISSRAGADLGRTLDKECEFDAFTLQATTAGLLILVTFMQILGCPVFIYSTVRFQTYRPTSSKFGHHSKSKHLKTGHVQFLDPNCISIKKSLFERIQLGACNETLM